MRCDLCRLAWTEGAPCRWTKAREKRWFSRDDRELAWLLGQPPSVLEDILAAGFIKHSRRGRKVHRMTCHALLTRPYRIHQTHLWEDA